MDNERVFKETGGSTKILPSQEWQRLPRPTHWVPILVPLQMLLKICEATFIEGEESWNKDHFAKITVSFFID